jgi:hypothetical protein
MSLTSSRCAALGGEVERRLADGIEPRDRLAGKHGVDHPPFVNTPKSDAERY